jgi:phosphoribosylanthranilate isomerase
MPSGPGVISDELISQIIQHVNGRVDTVLLTSRTDADSLIEQHRMCSTSMLQLVADVSIATLQRLRIELPEVKLIKVVHVVDETAIAIAQRLAPHVDALLLDSYSTHGSTRQLGGTGAAHDWAISRAICDTVTVPVLLAGGLRASNVGEALQRVKSFGVDVCSGVRSNDLLDNEKLVAFVAAARATRLAAQIG